MSEVVMRPVVSSYLRAVGWDKENRELVLEFLNGDRGVYEEVDEAVVDAIVKAASPGKAVHMWLKGKYRWRVE